MLGIHKTTILSYKQNDRTVLVIFRAKANFARGTDPCINYLLATSWATSTERLLRCRIIDVEKVHRTLVLRDNENPFDKLLVSSTYVLAFSFLLSAILNFILARVLLKSPSGSVEFTQELGKMTALSWPVIVIPSTVVMAYALWRLFAGIKRLTGLGMEDVFKTPPPKEK